MSSNYKFINKLHNQHVLILGGTSGIGFAIAQGVIENGGSVFLSGSRQEKLDRAMSRLREAYPKETSGELASSVGGITCDLSNVETVEDNLKNLLKAATDGGNKKINHIAFTAGDAFTLPKLSETSADSVLKKFFSVRYIGALMLAKLAPGTYMDSSPDSSITVTGGVNTRRPGPGWALAAGAGGAIEGITRGLAIDLAPIRVNMVSPGAVETELFDGIFGGASEEAEERKKVMIEMFTKNTLVKRIGRPEDTAEAYLYIMRDGFITGTDVGSNGGRILV